jgi:hypothetical protein
MGWIKEIKNQPRYPGFCQNGESDILKYIFNNIGLTNKFLVDIGAWDGTHLSNTKAFMDTGWNGLLVDAKDFPGVFHSFVTVENITEILTSNNVPKEFDLLSLDIDGNDYWILKKILQDYRPRVIVSEYNSEHPLSESKTIEYDPKFAFDATDYYGYTYGAGLKLAKEFGYTVVYQISDTNLFYLRNDIVNEEPEFDVKQFRHWNKESLKQWITI